MSVPANEPRRPKAKRVGLKHQHQLFVENYLVTLNSTAAARAAGYSEQSIRTIACEVRWRKQVDAEISLRMARACAISNVNVARVLHEIACVAFANVADFLEDDGKGNPRFKPYASLTRDQLAAVSEFTTETTTTGVGKCKTTVVRSKLKLNNKLDAAERLGRHLKLFKEEDREPTEREAVFNRALSAVDRLLERIIAEGADRDGARSVPAGLVFSPAVFPPTT